LPRRLAAPEAGQIRFVGCIRKILAGSRKLTLILTDVEHHNGSDRVVTSLKYRTVTPSLAAIDSLGGWQYLERLTPTQRIAAYVPESGGLEASKLQVVDSF
jgi:hypothetical protein